MTSLIGRQDVQAAPTVGSLLRTVMLIPSFYGGLTWILCFALYDLRLIAWNQPGSLIQVLGATAALAFIVATALYFPRYYRWSRAARDASSQLLVERAQTPERARSELFLAIGGLHILGVIGLAKYLFDLSAYFGGYGRLFILLIHQSWVIRAASPALASSWGTQVAYFGWLAIGLTAYWKGHGQVRWPWVALALVQFTGNLLFISRIRPIWIVFTALLMYLHQQRGASAVKSMRNAAISVMVIFVIFLGIASWNGKLQVGDEYEPTSLPKPTQPVYEYATAGFAYLNQLLSEQSTPDYLPLRTGSVLFESLSRVGLTNAPPPRILPFYYVPFATNVGTFLEAFYRDGGVVYMLVGIFVYSFGANELGCWLLRRNTVLTLFAWANICFVVSMGFFASELGSFPMWLFLGIGVLDLALRRRVRPG